MPDPSEIRRRFVRLPVKPFDRPAEMNEAWVGVEGEAVFMVTKERFALKGPVTCSLAVSGQENAAAKIVSDFGNVFGQEPLRRKLLSNPRLEFVIWRADNLRSPSN
ncbi:MAG: hypothetical protein HY344_01955 [Candidatus Levybacteria bacterium]|nr:hypothetical protein [Candidatus Levybacteria bacterium]